MATIVGARSPLFYKQVKGGLPAILDTSKFTGNIFFVDSANTARGGDSAGYGTSPDTPFLTIDYAIGQCTANQGDVIIVLPGHAETVIAAGGIALDVAGITVIGLGLGAARPTVTFTTAATATMTVGAANIKVQNILFVCGIDEQVIMVDVNADDFTIEDSEFRGSATAQPLACIDNNGGAANAADRMIVRGCKFISYTAAASANEAIELGEVNDEILIEENIIDGDWGNAGIHNPAAKILTNLRILRNVVRNRQTGDHAIELVSACTGEAVDNRLFGDTLGTIFDPGSLFCSGNLESDAIDQAGVPSPRTMAGDALPSGIATTSFVAGAIDAAAIADSAIDRATLAADTGLRSIRSNTAAAGAAGSITLDAAADANNDYYKWCIIYLTGGTGVGQARLITGYTGATQVAAITPNWVTNPDNTSTFAIMPINQMSVGDLKADVINNSHLADNALASEQFAASAGEKTCDGIVVTKATAALPQTNATGLFTVTGLCLLRRIVGYVTVQVGAVANATKLVGDSTGAGVTTDLCATVELNGAAVDSRLEITGTFANAMVKTVDIPAAKTQAVDLVLPPGVINLNCAGSDGGTGRVRWSVTYVPLEAGASMVAV